MERRNALQLVTALVAAACMSVASAQPYPSKPVRLVVTFAAGGGADFVARAVAARLGERLGQPVVVENRAGAGGAIGMEHVAKAAPDGYTLLLGAAGPMTILPHTQPNVSYDTLKDYEPIALAGSSPFVLTVRNTLDVKTVADLTALAKAQPGKLNFGSSGPGGAPHLAGELYKARAGVNLVHVPYKGLAPAISDLLGGQVDVLFADVGLIAPHVKAGKLKPIAVTSARRSSMLPDLPTMKEAGVADYQAGTWYGILAPAGTPAEVVSRLNAELVKVLATPEIKSQFAAQGLEPGGGTPQEFTSLIRDEHAKWAKLLKEANIKTQ